MTEQKHIFVKKVVLLKSSRETKYNKLQHFIAKLFKLTLADTYYHQYRLDFKSRHKVRKGNILRNEQGVFFYVLDVRNWQMIVVTVHPQLSKPKLHGKLFIIEQKEINQKNQK